MNKISVEGREVIPLKIVCVGQNYVKHIEELGNEIPENMVVFLKPNSSISDKIISFQQEQIHYEGELSFVYEGGRFSAVGFGLDLTKRGLQTSLKKKGLPWERAKAFNGSAVFSNFVAITDSKAHFSIRLDINEKNAQTGDVQQMMYKPDEILSEILTFMTLNDGDIVMTGTPSGVGTISPYDVFWGTIYENGKEIISATWVAE